MILKKILVNCKSNGISAEMNDVSSHTEYCIYKFGEDSIYDLCDGFRAHISFFHQFFRKCGKAGDIR